MRDTQQIEIGDLLQKYNDQPIAQEFTEKVINLNVALTPVALSGTNVSSFSRKPRGVAILFNNIVDPRVNPNFPDFGQHFKNGLCVETKRFANIFKQMDFKVYDIYYKKNVNEIRKMLPELRYEENDWREHEAFIFMIITHGEQDEIFGGDACTLIDYPPDNMDPDQIKSLIHNDKMTKNEVLRFFSKESFPELENVQKLFFFICCRVESSETNVRFEYQQGHLFIKRGHSNLTSKAYLHFGARIGRSVEEKNGFSVE